MRVGEDVDDDDDDDVDDELEDEMGDDGELDNGGMFVNEGDEKKKKKGQGQKKMKSIYASAEEFENMLEATAEERKKKWEEKKKKGRGQKRGRKGKSFDNKRRRK